MGIWFGPGVGGGGGKSPLKRTDFTYTGNELEFKTSGNDWEIALLTEGANTITFNKRVVADIFLVAGGAAGASADENQAGNGGNGGGSNTWSEIIIDKGASYTATVGASGSATSFGSMIVNSGAGSSGGIITSTGNEATGSDGTIGTLAFNNGDCLNFPDRHFGAGGGSGARNYKSQNGLYSSKQQGGLGNQTGGGNGGGFYIINGTKTRVSSAPGGKNTGSGGGGGERYYNGEKNKTTEYEGADGGSGIILIRNHHSS